MKKISTLPPVLGLKKKHELLWGRVGVQPVAECGHSKASDEAKDKVETKDCEASND